MMDNKQIPVEDTLENIESSMNSCAMALAHLSHSLKQGGFDKSIETYKKMADTILGQKMYIGPSASPAIHKNFASIMKSANEIYSVFQPYAEIMNRLRMAKEQEELYSLDASEKMSEEEEAKLLEVKESPVQKVMSFLRSEKKPVSFTRLRSKCGAGRKELKEIMLGLTESGQVIAKNSGGREIYSLSI